jgi:23S rRNA (cytosine1962-C5)-methyltransferase
VREGDEASEGSKFFFFAAFAAFARPVFVILQTDVSSEFSKLHSRAGKCFHLRMVPCVIFEDEHLLVVAKPAGWNTHAPSPHAGEGIYDWLKHREPRWAALAIIHRLDKETSGVLVFGKTPLANKSLTEQFTTRAVRKKYLLLTDRKVPATEFAVKTTLARLGEKYASGPGGEVAETKFRRSRGDEAQNKIGSRQSAIGNQWEPPHIGGYERVEAEPFTGRTHQIRVHAAESGFPILGDTLYGGTAAARVYLHAAEIAFTHPATREPVTFSAPANFDANLEGGDTSPLSDEATRRLVEKRGPVRALQTAAARLFAIRSAVIEPEAATAFRLIHGASDGWPGWFVEKLGDFLLSQADAPLSAQQSEELSRLARQFSARGAYHKILSRHLRPATVADASPQLVLGDAAPERFEILENGLRYELSFREGYSVGLFLDQRDNRRRLLAGHVAADFQLPTANCQFTAATHANAAGQIGNWQLAILNAFAYTCGFSVAAAKAGARTTSLDLSRKYLDWGRRNFALNGLDPAAHEFIYGDTFDWLRRLAKKGRAFDVIVLDPPTFSRSKEHGTFRADKDYGRLVTATLPVLKPGGVLLASTNAADWPPESFLTDVATAVRAAKRKITRQHYVPQPPDFPVSRAEPAYLKTVWLQIK